MKELIRDFAQAAHGLYSAADGGEAWERLVIIPDEAAFVVSYAPGELVFKPAGDVIILRPTASAQSDLQFSFDALLDGAEEMAETHRDKPSQRLTPAQKVAMKMKALGFEDRDSAMEWLSIELGREITSRNDLTPDEVSLVMAALETIRLERVA